MAQTGFATRSAPPKLERRKPMTRKISAFLALLAVAALIVVAPTPAPALTLEDVTVTWFNPLGPGIATVTNPFVEGAGNARNFEVRWGAPSADPTLQSGLGFDPLFPPSSEVPIGLNFTLGTLFHFNNPIFLGSQLTSVDLTLGAIFTSAIPALAEFTFRMLINETPNNGSPCDEGGAQPCRDAIRFTSLDVVPQTFTVDGETFTLVLIGFGADGSQTTFFSPEGGTNSTPLIARIERPRVPNPSALLLIGLGLVGLAGISRIRSRQN